MTMPDWTEANDQATHWDELADVFCNLNGWFHDGTFYGEKNARWGTDRYTPRPVEPATTALDGTGLPPAGTECEAVIGAQKPRTVCFVGIKSSGSVVIETVDGELKSYHRSQVIFRPIRTQAQREREELIEKALAMDCHPREGLLSRHDFCGAMYDAGMLRSKHSQDDRTKLVTSLNQLRGETDVGIVADVILSIGFRLER